MKFHVKAFAAVTIAVLLPVPVFAMPERAAERKVQRILMLSPFNLSFVQYFQESVSYLDALNQANGSYLVEHFSLERPHAPYSPEKLAEFGELLNKIRAGRYQLVVTFYGPMLEMLRKELPDIPREVKFIVCGLPPSLADMVPQAPNVYSLYQDFALRKNLKLICTLFPERKRIILLTHWNPVGREIQRLVREEIRNFPKLELLTPDNDQYTPTEILNYVEQHKKDAVVLFFGWFNHHVLNSASLGELMEMLGHNRELPLFVMHSSLLHYGTVGGCMEDGKAYGKQAAALTLQLLNGENPPQLTMTIPASTILNQSLLDFYGVPENMIPAEAVVFGRESNNSLWEFFRKNPYLLPLIFSFLLVIICILMFFTMRFKRLSRQVIGIFRNLPFRVLIVDANEKVLMYHVSMLQNRIETLRDFLPELYPLLQKTLQKIHQDKCSCTEQYMLNGRHQRGYFIYLPKNIFGCPTMLGIGLDVDDLFYLTQNEKIHNECLRTMLPEFNASIAPVLKILREYLHGDHCYLLHYCQQRASPEFVEESCAEDIPCMKELFSQHRLPEIEAWFTQRAPGKFSKQQLEHYTQDNSSDQMQMVALRAQEVKDLYVIPIFFNKQVWGSLELVFKRKHANISAIQEQVFPIVAQMIELILLRKTFISNLAQARNEALAAAKAKGNFLATMSHELRTPLNAVIGFSELLMQNGKSQEEQKEYVAGINYASKSLLSLINNILDFSKLEAEQMKIVLEPFCLGELFKELEAIFFQMAMAKGLRLEFFCQVIPELLLDAYRIKQILMNLIGNAIKFTEKGGIRVCAAYQNGSLSISVADTGSGIAKEQQKNIFNPYFQVDEQQDTRQLHGTGLGLMITKKLAEQMNGDLRLVSEVGMGSTFILMLSNVAPVGNSSPLVEQAVADAPLLHAVNILLVDDVPLNLKVMEAMFKNMHLPVRKAFSGAEALKLLKEQPADVVFTDLRMPEMDGRELAKRIRTMPAMRHAKIIAVTADIQFDSEGNNEFDSVLIKPISIPKLRKALQENQPAVG